MVIITVPSRAGQTRWRGRTLRRWIITGLLRISDRQSKRQNGGTEVRQEEKEEPKFEEIEKLIGQQVEWAALPENLVISDVLLDDEKVQTSNIVYQKGKPKGGGAFHAKSAKNSKTPQKVRKDRTKEGRRKK